MSNNWLGEGLGAFVVLVLQVPRPSVPGKTTDKTAKILSLLEGATPSY
jgi:hypothetical protein